MHETSVRHCHGDDDLQERVLMIGQRQHFANLAREVLEEHLIDGSLHTLYKHRQVGGHRTTNNHSFLLPTTPWLLRLVAIADDIVLLTIHAGWLRLIAFLLAPSTRPTPSLRPRVSRLLLLDYWVFPGSATFARSCKNALVCNSRFCFLNIVKRLFF